MKVVELLPIDQSGSIAIRSAQIPEVMRQNCAATASFYKVVGFNPPWIGYVSVADGQPVGGGGFKGPPQDNRVEIAYYTLPNLEGHGWATATASELIKIARFAAPPIVVAAQTLPERNASTSVLRKLGFELQDSLVHPEDGEVWEWRMNAQPGAPADAPALRAGVPSPAVRARRR
jgi:RimJ/RimL family protein N-acetyltransferase